MNDLAARFRELRLSKGLSSTAVAKPRYSVSYVSQIERGQRKPSPDALRYFARRLGVSPEYLWTGVPDDLPQRLRYEAEQAEADIAQDRPKDAERRARRVIEEAERFELIQVQGRALCSLGEALNRQARYAESIEAFEKARTLATIAPIDRVAAVAGLARASRSAGDLSYAARVVEEFLEADAAPEGPDAVPELTSADVAELQAVLVGIYCTAADFRRAEDAASRALRAINRDTPPRIEAEAYWNASRVMAERRRWEEALEMARRARLLLERSHSRRELSRLYVAYAFLCLEAEPPRIEEAERNLDLGEGLLADLGMPAEYGNVYVERSWAAFLRGEFGESVEHAGRVVGIEGVEDAVRARAFLVQGKALGRLRRYEEARRALHEAMVIYGSHEQKGQLAWCWRELGAIAETEGDLSAAVEAYHAAFGSLESLISMRL
jgi:tetratricopeptide (TPR) repeat protein